MRNGKGIYQPGVKELDFDKEGNDLIQRIASVSSRVKEEDRKKLDKFMELLGEAEKEVFKPAAKMLEVQEALHSNGMADKIANCMGLAEQDSVFAKERTFLSCDSKRTHDINGEPFAIFSYSPLGENMLVHIYPKEKTFLFFQKDDEGYVDENDNGVTGEELVRGVKSGNVKIGTMIQPLRMLDMIVETFPSFYMRYINAVNKELSNLETDMEMEVDD